MGTTAKGPRSVRLVRPPDDRGVFAFAITQGTNASHYTAKEIRCDIGGRGFAVHRTGVGTRYDVRVGDPADTSCECMGYLAHGRCKHVLGLAALIRKNVLDRKKLISLGEPGTSVPGFLSPEEPGS